jgi:predicted MFS family arabinose efflux permease
MLILGPALSLVPSKAIYLGSLFVFTLGSLICGVAESFTTLVVGRAIAGWGGGGYISPLSLSRYYQVDLVLALSFQF